MRFSNVLFQLVLIYEYSKQTRSILYHIQNFTSVIRKVRKMIFYMLFLNDLYSKSNIFILFSVHIQIFSFELYIRWEFRVQNRLMDIEL